MLENITIARPYAQAAFEHAKDMDHVAQWSDMLALLGRIIADSRVIPLLSNPKVTDRQLQEFIFEVCGDKLSQDGKNFIKILIKAERLPHLPQIARLFGAMRAQAEGRIDVEVVSAHALQADQKQRISESMAKRLGKTVTITSSVDESLIGGAVIRAGDSVIDASIRGKLAELKNQLA